MKYSIMANFFTTFKHPVLQILAYFFLLCGAEKNCRPKYTKLGFFCKKCFNL